MQALDLTRHTTDQMPLILLTGKAEAPEARDQVITPIEATPTGLLQTAAEVIEATDLVIEALEV